MSKIYDLSTGKELVEVRKTKRKTFHVMDDGTMVSYLKPSKTERFKEKVKKTFNYFFELED
ncbi:MULTISPECIES: hypothetical protein [Oceanobacillus]|uniref:Uncharacterized protein n=1 Tax=Oceanobacillus kimchii TaxID=746691 RepID=A0ABQ5TN74_9BACI|nr:hypothetical protein [Oceanobacillus kimchii]GLO68259.1 hypothetical protein MACH08_40430 [Oceanobacillus kimchii]